MAKPTRSEWVRRVLKRNEEEYEKKRLEKYNNIADNWGYDEAYKFDQKARRDIQNRLAQDEVLLNDYYTKLYETPSTPKLVVETPKLKGIERYAKTRTKTGNEMFNLNYLVKEKSPRQFEKFLKATHGRTVKKMLLNNVKFAKAQGAKNWTARAEKFIKNFKGSKEELAYQVATRYGNKLGQYSSDFNLKKDGGMVKETERLTKSGKIRKRYAKRGPSPEVKEIEKRNKWRNLNLEAAMYRMFKIDNRGKDFDSEGNGIITQYWLNRIKDFSTIPRAGLGDLEEHFFEFIKPLGQVGGQTMYAVKLSPQAVKVLTRMRKQPETALNQYGRKFIELYKVKD